METKKPIESFEVDNKYTPFVDEEFKSSSHDSALDSADESHMKLFFTNNPPQGFLWDIFRIKPVLLYKHHHENTKQTKYAWELDFW